FAPAFLDKNVQHCLFKCWIGRVTVCFPTAIAHIEFDAASNWIAAIYPNCCIAKIRSGFAVPRSELDDVDFLAGRTDKVRAEISGEPARLELQFIWNTRSEEQRTLTNARGIAHLCVALFKRHRILF